MKTPVKSGLNLHNTLNLKSNTESDSVSTARQSVSGFGVVKVRLRHQECEGRMRQGFISKLINTLGSHEGLPSLNLYTRGTWQV
jgi:hypothetical protein